MYLLVMPEAGSSITCVDQAIQSPYMAGGSVNVLNESVEIRVSVPFRKAETGKKMKKNIRIIDTKKTIEVGNLTAILSYLLPVVCIKQT